MSFGQESPVSIWQWLVGLRPSALYLPDGYWRTLSESGAWFSRPTEAGIDSHDTTM